MEKGLRSPRPGPSGQRGASPAQVTMALLVLGLAAFAVAVAIGRVGL